MVLTNLKIKQLIIFLFIIFIKTNIICIDLLEVIFNNLAIMIILIFINNAENIN